MKKIVNFIHNRKFKEIVLLVILFSLYIFINAFSYAAQVSNDLQKIE